MSRSRVPAALAACLFAVSLAAQDAPPPPTPYPPPVAGYVGRYLDSTATASWQYMGPTLPRTYRADVVKAAPERDMLYMIVGGTFVGQTLSTFAERVRTTPHQTIRRQFGGETYLPFEKWVDVERSPGWQIRQQDAQRTLADFDWDDRGYVYLAYTWMGFGIIDEDFQKVAQLMDVGPDRVVAFRSGTSYYALLNQTTPALYDVTTPSALASVVLGSFDAFADAAKTKNGRIAFVTKNARLHIHTPATILGQQPPIYISPVTTFRQVDTDGINFYALSRGGRDIHVIRPSGATYTETITTIGEVPNDLIDYGDGYLTVTGVSAHRRVAIYRVDRGALTLLHDGQYFHNWFMELLSMNVTPIRLLPVFDGKQMLFVAAVRGLGDVFTLTPRPSVTTRAQFAPATIAAGGTSLFTLTIANPSPEPVPFGLDEKLPTHVVATGGGLRTTCGRGVLTAAAQGSSWQLTDATVAASSSCTATLEVTSAVPGTHTNGEARLIVVLLDAPQVAKSFASSQVPPGMPVRMTITLANPNAEAITGVAFTDDYPAALVNATPVSALNTCGGTLLAANGGGSLSLSGGTIPASGSCTVAVDVVVTQPGTVTNTIPAGAVTSGNADPSATAATAVINAAAVAGVPALSEWALLALMAALGGAGLLRMRM